MSGEATLHLPPAIFARTRRNPRAKITTGPSEPDQRKSRAATSMPFETHVMVPKGCTHIKFQRHRNFSEISKYSAKYQIQKFPKVSLFSEHILGSGNFNKL
jgi:hypothetical protein